MIHTPCKSNFETIEETGFGYTLSLIGGKYKMVVLFWLAKRPPCIRFNEMQRLIGGISYKTLSATLKELEQDGLIIRTEYPEIPPKVEYQLSERGATLLPILDSLCHWGHEHRQVENDS